MSCVFVVYVINRNKVGYQPKKAKTLTREEVSKFRLEAPDDMYLMIKVCTIFGVSGACRRDELWNMCIDDVKKQGSLLVVNIRILETVNYNKYNKCYT